MRSHAHDFYLGLDLGKLRDSTALVLLERYSTRQGWDPYYLCEVYRWKTVIRLAERVPLGTSYPAVVERVRAVIDQLAPRGPVHLTVDATGVGQAVVDALREAKLKMSPHPRHHHRSRTRHARPRRLRRSERGLNRRPSDDVLSRRSSRTPIIAPPHRTNHRAPAHGP